MIVAATNVIILFQFTFVPTVTNVPMVTFAHMLAFYIGYEHYPCCYGQYVYLDYKFISVSMVKRTARTFSVGQFFN